MTKALTVVLNRLLNLVLQIVYLVRQFLVFLLVLADLCDVLLDPVFLSTDLVKPSLHSGYREPVYRL